jgi:chemotaxis response regulator CheB
MDERVNEILKEAFDATYQHTLHTYAHDQKQQEYLAQRIATLEAQNAALLALVRNIEDNTPRSEDEIYPYTARKLWQVGERCRTLLAELDKGETE